MDVLCDTSFLLILVTKPIKLIDVVEREIGKINFILPDVIIEELIKLQQKSPPRKAKAAKLALEISKKFSMVKTSKIKHTDDNIFEYAYLHKCAVATLDKHLIKNLIAENIVVISLRNNKMIILNNHRNRQT
jgi:rRNA-processing protein FCF1